MPQILIQIDNELDEKVIKVMQDKSITSKADIVVYLLKRGVENVQSGGDK